jgi:hypothetical protein
MERTARGQQGYGADTKDTNSNNDNQPRLTTDGYRSMHRIFLNCSAVVYL